MPLKKIIKRRGFTLFEVLIVASLVGITGIAVYNALSGGIRVWEHSRRYTGEEDVIVLFEKLTDDLANAFQYSGLKFEGTAQKLSIPTIVRVRGDEKSPYQKGTTIDQMGRAEYFFQEGKKAVLRRQAGYGQASDKKFEPAKVVAARIARLQFTYFIKKDDEIKQQKTFKDDVPLSVQVDLDFIENSGKLRRMTRIIDIPWN